VSAAAELGTKCIRIILERARERVIYGVNKACACRMFAAFGPRRQIYSRISIIKEAARRVIVLPQLVEPLELGALSWSINNNKKWAGNRGEGEKRISSLSQYSKKSFAGEKKFERIMKEWPGKFKTVYAAKNMNGKLWLNTQRKCKCTDPLFILP
jgi:hypothetical protein